MLNKEGAEIANAKLWAQNITDGIKKLYANIKLQSLPRGVDPLNEPFPLARDMFELFINSKIKLVYGFALLGVILAFCVLMMAGLSRHSSIKVGAAIALVMVAAKMLMHIDVTTFMVKAMGEIELKEPSGKHGVICVSDIYGSFIVGLELFLVFITSHILMSERIMRIGGMKLNVGRWSAVISIGVSIAALYRMYTRAGDSLTTVNDFTVVMGSILLILFIHLIGALVSIVVDRISSHFSKPKSKSKKVTDVKEFN